MKERSAAVQNECMKLIKKVSLKIDDDDDHVPWYCLL